MTIDIQGIIKEWWDSYQADPRSSFDRIVSGMRKELYSADGEMKYPGDVVQPIVKSQRQTGSCQYWMNGLPAVCKNWDHATRKCVFEFENEENKPSGYGLGDCDNLGRRSWCSKYEKSKDDNLNEYVCVLPCIERSGRGKQISSEFETISYRPYLPSEIQGYNEDEEGVGRCDGWGLGRGDREAVFDSLEDLYKYGPVCRHYRPQQMGFGAIQPHPFPGSDAPGKPFNYKVNKIPQTLEELHDGSKSDPLIVMPKRLPFIFQIYNARAMYQQCAHWKHRSPTFFTMSTDTDVSLQNINLDGDIYCEYAGSNNLASPFLDEETRWADIPWVVANVTAKYGGIICNGAKPECPCYTGKWIYCTDNNMRDGMRITADQIFELRFWASNWASQKEYDDFYLSKPGPTAKGYSDESTAAIYTFTKWLRLDAGNPNDSIMQGYKHTMCMPAPLQKKEFIPSEYITKDLITYPKLNEFTGTNVESNRVAFPTLVRELEDPESFVPDIEIVYPYNTIDPWVVEICQQEDVADFCVHNTTLMENPHISVVGKATLESEVYVINSALMEDSRETVKAFEYMDKYIRANQITSQTLWVDYNRKIDKLISYCEMVSQGFVAGTTSDRGFFCIDTELKCNDYNELYVICKYNIDGAFPEYTFRKLKVKSIYWAGVIYQKTMTHTHFPTTGFNAFPDHFEPAPSITAEIVKTTGNISSVIPLYFHQRKSWHVTRSYYGYCLNEYETTEDDVVYWTQVGSTGYIWAELDNIDLSYLWEFSIEEAYLELRLTTDADGNSKKRSNVNLCGADNSSQNEEVKISLEKIDISRRTIPPNAVLFKAAQPMGFFNEDWKLVVKYKYRLLETFKLNPVWPLYIDENFSNVYFDTSPFSVEHSSGESSFSVSGGGTTSQATFRVMAFLTDEYGRVQAAIATKMLVQGYVLGCLNIEIEYIYAAPSKGYVLQPAGGFATWRGAPKAISMDGDGGYHSNRAPCGDHSCDARDCVGPMWYPFDKCADKVYYNIYTPAAYCLLPMTEGEDEIEKMGNSAWRYQMAPEYEAWVTEAGNWLASCGAQWIYYYSQAESSSNVFTGSVVKRVGINYFDYINESWTLPPFGNSSRAYIERYVSRDYYPFIDYSGSFPAANAKYLPAVFDSEDFSSNPDPFSGSAFTGSNLTYFSMLNNYVADFISEHISDARYRFEDIIETHEHFLCSYPEPIILNEDGDAVVCRYGFKNSNHVWAWQEYWEDIERNLDNEEKFTFIVLERPEYYVDSLKKEHRLITDEGVHTLVFEPPIGASSDGETDNPAVYPSISIDGAFPRYFNIIYSDYSTGYADWKDESDTGEEGSSNGESIYEKANNGSGLNGFEGDNNIQWVHSFDCVFDGGASETLDDDRKIYLGINIDTEVKTYGYFNRGLNITIPKNRLKFLPMGITDVSSADAFTETADSFIGYWDMGNEFGVAPVEVVVEGVYGTSTSVDGSEIIYSQPYVRVAESTDPAVFSGDSVVPDWPADKTIGAVQYLSGQGLNATSKFSISLELDRTPTRFTQRLNYFMVSLAAFTGEELKLTKFEVKTGRYVRSEERIRVWERKFNVGSASLAAPNADGPNTTHYRTHHRDRENSGQFYPMNESTLGTSRTSGNGSVISKVTAVSFNAQLEESEEISTSISDLKQVEKDAQKDLYEEAIALEGYDTLSFATVLHPALQEWYSKINLNMAPAPDSLSMIYEKITWDKSKYSTWLKQDADFWTSGGHYFAWSDKVLRTKCYTTGPVQEVFSAQFIHYRHGWKEDIIDPGHAYAGYGRTEFYNGVLWGQNLQGKEPTEPDLVTEARNGVMGGNG